MTRITFWQVAVIAITFAVLAGTALSAQDKYSLQSPLPFGDIRGYESWEVISVSSPAGKIKAIVGNPAMIQAYKSGIPGNGKPFPDGSKIAKIQWVPKKSTEAPFDVRIPDVLDEVEFMEKDAKRFADSNGWGYAPFKYDAAADSFSPIAKDAKCGAACHTNVTEKDLVFTEYAKR